MNISNKNILFVAPHCDDLEFSCFATLNRLSKNNNIYIMNFSFCEESLPDGYLVADIKREFWESIDKVDVFTENVINHDFPVRYFHEYRQDILQILIDFKNQNKIDIVFCPNSKDCHQDHNVIYEETIRAFKTITIFGYDMPWNNFNLNANFVFKITKEDLDKKIECIGAYKSQVIRNKSDPEIFYGLAKVRGIQADLEYAEAFETIRMVIGE